MFMELRNEIDHLLYLYFNSIGIIQRDFDGDGAYGQIEEICESIKKCKTRINELLDSIAKSKNCKRSEIKACNPADLEDSEEFLEWCLRTDSNTQVEATPTAEEDQ